MKCKVLVKNYMRITDVYLGPCQTSGGALRKSSWRLKGVNYFHEKASS